MSENQLSYAALSQGEVRTDGYFGCPTDDGDWLSILPLNKDSADRMTGWKFHISVGSGNVAPAWDIVTESLQTMQAIGYAKGRDYSLHAKVVTAQQDITNADDPQRGKIITLFELQEMPLPVWAALLSEIESRFLSEGIRPGFAVQNDKQVAGSQFVSYSPGRDANGNRIQPEDRPALIAANDQFAALVVDPTTSGLAATLSGYQPPAEPLTSRPTQPAMSASKKALLDFLGTLHFSDSPPPPPRGEPNEKAELLKDAARKFSWQTELRLPDPETNEVKSAIRTRPGIFQPEEIAVLHDVLHNAGVSAYVDANPQEIVSLDRNNHVPVDFLTLADGPDGMLDKGEITSLVVHTDTQPATKDDATLQRIVAILTQAATALTAPASSATAAREKPAPAFKG